MPSNQPIRQISRERLQTVLKHPDLVRLFEDILYSVGVSLPDNTTTAQETAELALSRASVSAQHAIPPIFNPPVSFQDTQALQELADMRQYKSGETPSGGAIPLTTATPQTMASVLLAPGEWEVWVNAYFKGDAITTVLGLTASISLVVDTLNPAPGYIAIADQFGNTPFADVDAVSLNVGPVRLSVDAPTGVMYVVEADFAAGACEIYGIIQAARRG